jgi:3-dehydroquinate dehydratase
MGELGQPSRVCGGTFGSCITFGASPFMETAPGQIGIRALRDHLQKYYEEDR